MAYSKPNRNPGLLVILCGLITTAISLGIVSFLAGTEFNIIGWYMFFIIPVGALLVGMASGSGYYIGSKMTNSKIAGIFLWLVFLISVAGYIGSHYVTYQQLVEPGGISFFEYIKTTAENTTLGRAGEDGETGALGKLGYLFLLLEAVGFSIGAMMAVQLLSTAPYCGSCQLYLKNVGTGYIGSGAERSALKKLNKKAKTQIIEGAIEEVIEAAQAFGAVVAEASYEDTILAVKQMALKQNGKALASTVTNVLKCSHCSAHHVKVGLSIATFDDENNETDLFALDKPSAVK